MKKLMTLAAAAACLACAGLTKIGIFVTDDYVEQRVASVSNAVVAEYEAKLAAVSNALAAAAGSVPSNLVARGEMDAALEPLRADSWVRAGDWAAVSAVVSEPVSTETVAFKTNLVTGCVMSNSVFTQSYSLSADLSVESLDELTQAFNPGVVRYVPLTGGSVSGSRFTAATAGVYRVRAESANLGVRYCDVPLTQWQSTVSNATVYVADAALDGLWRKSVNDAVQSNLSANFVSPFTVPAYVVNTDAATGATTMQYKVWWTLRNPCRPVSGFTVQGYRSRNALSPHLMVAARHYCAGADKVDRGGVGVHKDWNESWLTFHDPVNATNVSVHTKGGMTGDTCYDVVPIDDGCGFPLAMWAITNGWTQAELAEMNIDDIEVYPVLDGGAVPDACCPYVMGEAALDARFGGGGRVMGWAFSQTYAGSTGPDGMPAGNYMTPCSINVANGASSWTCAAYITQAATDVRADIRATIAAMQPFPPIYGGDSSGGVYILHEDRWILVSQYRTISSGPSFTKALPVLRKLCAAYGDTLKEINE